MIDKPLIALAPVGDAPQETVTEMGPILAARLDAKVVLAPGIALVSSAYNAHRRQYHSTPVLDALARTRRRDWERMLGVVDVDLYVPISTATPTFTPCHSGRAAMPPRR